jgi:general secretion pathway protein D
MRTDVSIESQRVRRLLGTFVAIAIACSGPALARAQNDDQKAAGEEEALYSCGKARGQVSVSFKPEVELKDLITWAMGFTCRNFVMSSAIAGRNQKVTIIAPKKMSPTQAYRVFLVALQTMNLTVVPKGNVLEIVEAPQSKTEALPVYKKGTPPATAQMVRAVIRPEHITVDDLTTILNAMKSKDGVVTPVPKFDLVMITDYGSHISQMQSLVNEIDEPSPGEQLYMIKVRYADATELATKLQEILAPAQGAQPAAQPARRGRRTPQQQRGQPTPPQQAGGAASEDIEDAVPSKIIADDRINALILLATEPAYLRTRALVRRLDVEVEVEGAGRIHVYALENADSEELATTLQSVISGITPPQQGAGQPGRPAPQRQPVPGGDLGGAATFEGQVRVTHDKPTNSLVIVASVKDYLALRDVVRKLDTPRRQVFIEAVILELKVDNGLDLGVSFHGGKDLDDGGIVVGGLQHSNLQSLNVASLASQTGLLGGLIGPLLPNAEQLIGTSIPSYGVLFQALANNNNVNVLSSPHILTTDNEAAEISVGENIPYQSSFSNFGFGGGGGGQAPGGGGFGFPVQSIQRQDVALTLKITPHINASDMVRLEIDQEISDIASPNFEGLGPSWAKRTIKTTVVVRDQQSIVIGGLMSDRVTYSESKVPLLGDIPILGYLFKYTRRSKAKTNLLVLLTPYVIKDQMDIEAIVQRKVRERREFVRAFVGLQTADFQTSIDYRRKRGLIEEINRTVKAIEEERRILEELDQKLEPFPDGPVEYGAMPAAAPEGEPSTAADPGADAGEAPQPETPPSADEDTP